MIKKILSLLFGKRYNIDKAREEMVNLNYMNEKNQIPGQSTLFDFLDVAE